jgi:hypothetical protein
MNAKNFLSTNFIMAALLLVSAIFSISGEVTQQGFALLTGAIAFAGLAREAFKSAKFIGWDKFLDANVWNYLVGAVVVVLPALEPAMPALKKVIDAVVLKDWGAVLSGVISLGTVVWYTVIKPKIDAKAEAGAQ